MRVAIIRFNGKHNLIYYNEGEFSHGRQKFYWGTGTSWCIFHGDMQIVEEIAEIEEDDSEAMKNYEIWFNTKYNKPISYLDSSDGWMSPSGKYYPCQTGYHDEKIGL